MLGGSGWRPNIPKASGDRLSLPPRRACGGPLSSLAFPIRVSKLHHQESILLSTRSSFANRSQPSTRACAQSSRTLNVASLSPSSRRVPRATFFVFHRSMSFDASRSSFIAST